MKFYERAEIKDCLSYMRLLLNKDDNLAFERTINVPKRGVGPNTLQKIILEVREKGISFADSALDLIESGGLRGKVGISIKRFLNQLAQYRNALSSIPHQEVVDTLLNESGYIEMWKATSLEENRDRIDNIKELVRSLSEYNNLEEYLEHISLVADTDDRTDGNQVSVMTIHAAKGLEFDTVFLPGWEETIFPSNKSIEEQSLEEERRLAYVAITRAKENLHISYASNRMIYGDFQRSVPSRFINELPKKDCEFLGLHPSHSVPTFIEHPKKQAFAEKRELINCDIYVGKKVNHKKFGEGVVLSVHGDVIQIFFEEAGLKKVKQEFLL